MKKILYTMIMAAGVAAFSSCEGQLDIPQKGVTPTENFYKTDADAEASLAAAYIGFMENVVGRQPDMNGPGIYTPLKIITNMCGDDLLYASGNYGDHEFSGDLNEFRYDTEAEVLKFQYSGIYQSIYTCNLVIHYFKDGTSPAMKQAVAEARGLRAYNYFLVANLWGNAPLVEDVLSGDALPTNCAATPEEGRKLMLEFVAKECEEIKNDLKARASKTDKDMAVRVSKGFAQALAGKAYLYLGQYEKARDILYDVIKSGAYDLVPGEKWADNFHIEGDCNEEKVFEINFEYNAGVGAWGGMIQRSSWMEANAWNWRAGNFVVNPAYVYCGIDGWGGLGVKQDFGDDFYQNDGPNSVRLNESIINVHDAIFGHALPYANDDLNNMKEAELLASDKVGINDPTQGLYGNSFWLQKKWLMRKNDTEGNKYGDNIRLNNYVIMRYAEVLLNYAEACAQSSDDKDYKGIQALKYIQTRAGSKHTSETLTLAEVKNERRFELFLENNRWFDIMRWNDAEAIARIEKNGTDVPHVFDKMFREPKAGEKVTWHKDGRLYTVPSQAAKDNGFEVGFKKGKHEFFPIPQTVMDKNPNMKQHANW